MLSKGSGHRFLVSFAQVPHVLVENTFGLVVSPFLASAVAVVCQPVLILVVVFAARRVSIPVVASLVVQTPTAEQSVACPAWVVLLTVVFPILVVA